jgi:hypothetical protein
MGSYFFISYSNWAAPEKKGKDHIWIPCSLVLKDTHPFLWQSKVGSFSILQSWKEINEEEYNMYNTLFNPRPPAKEAPILKVLGLSDQNKPSEVER